MAAGENPARATIPSAPHGEAPYSTASQTAWALLALMAAGEADNPAVARGIAYLIATQDRDGNWDEPWYTAVGFPRVFYLRYHGYRRLLPAMGAGALPPPVGGQFAARPVRAVTPRAENATCSSRPDVGARSFGPIRTVIAYCRCARANSGRVAATPPSHAAPCRPGSWSPLPSLCRSHRRRRDSGRTATRFCRRR